MSGAREKTAKSGLLDKIPKKGKIQYSGIVKTQATSHPVMNLNAGNCFYT